MAFDLKSLLHPDPENAWRNAGKVAKPVIDPIIAAKEKIGKGITDTLAILKEGAEKPTRGWYAIKADMARVSVRVGTKLLPIFGREHNVVPSHKASDFYTSVLEKVHSGVFDKEIRALIAGGKLPTLSDHSTQRRADFGKKRPPLSPEAKVERARKMAANKAAKAAQK
jgi:hypothetical protein